MSSNFHEIGFGFDQPHSLIEFLSARKSDSQSIPTPWGGHYSLFETEAGAQLFAQYSPTDELVGCNPHHKGCGRIRVTVGRVISNPRSPLDGILLGHLLDDQPGVPIAASVPNFRMHACFLSPGQTAELHTVAFPLSMETHLDAAEFADSPLGSLASSGAFIPSGTFRPGGEAIEPPQPVGIFVGVVQLAQRFASAFGGDYSLLHIKTLGGTLDVVGTSDRFRKEPEPGHIVSGQFWLSALLVDPRPGPPSKEERPTGKRRRKFFFGR